MRARVRVRVRVRARVRELVVAPRYPVEVDEPRDMLTLGTTLR